MKKQDKYVKAKIISIGDELLIGQVVNTNASWLGHILTVNGIEVISIIAVGDGEDDIMKALESNSDVDIVLMTGGLGPTADDITKPTLCKFFNTELIQNEDALNNVREIFKLRGYPMSERNVQQSFIPKSCTYIPNRFGTAPCMWFEKNATVYVSMPGVPFEMKSVFETEILHRLLSRFKVTPYISKVVMTVGVGESFLADRLKDWEEKLPDFLSLAYLPQYGMVRLRLEGRHEDKELLHSTVDKEIEKLCAIIPDNIFGFDDMSIAEVVIEMLKKENKTVSTAESCTGGAIARMITGIPGCSAVYRGSVVSYATDVKESVLSVEHQDIVKFSVVSKEVVEQMAKGVKELLHTDYALATTGIAGPDGGTEMTPLGTVWIAVATPDGIISQRHNFGKERDNNIQRACIVALEMLRQCLRKKEIIL